MKKQKTKHNHAGAHNPNAKLTGEMIAWARNEAAGAAPAGYGWQSALWRDFCRRYEVSISRGAFGDILHGRRWRGKNI